MSTPTGSWDRLREIPPAKGTDMVWTADWTTDGTTDRTGATDVEAPTVRWEPCTAFSDPGPSGVCDDCGWTAEDHEAPIGQVIAPVIALPIPEVLRRAS